MKKIVFASILLAIALLAKVESQSTASYGSLVTSLSTTSAGVVTGTSFGVPQGSASIITWSVVADGSAISTTLEGSLDNTTWFTVDTITTPATGAVKNYGFTSIKFVRISQVSRTGGTTTTGTIVTGRGFLTTTGSGSSNSSDRFLAGDGTAALPSFSYTAAPSLGFWRDPAVGTTHQGTFTVANTIRLSDGTVANPSYTFTSAPTSGFTLSGGNIAFSTAGVARILAGSSGAQLGSAGAWGWSSTADASGAAADLRIARASAGNLTITNAAGAIGSQIKVDALPTVASGFGTSPAITAGSTPFAGSVNVGTGGVATSGVINFNGTAFPSGPFCVCAPDLSNTTCRLTTTTTTLTMTANTAWPANDIIKWICVSSK